MLRILLSIAFIPVEIIMSIILVKLDNLQDIAWILWFNRCRGKVAKFFTRAFLTIWVASPLFAGICCLPLSKCTPEAYILSIRIIAVLLSIFGAGCVYYLAAWITSRKA